VNTHINGPSAGISAVLDTRKVTDGARVGLVAVCTCVPTRLYIFNAIAPAGKVFEPTFAALQTNKRNADTAPCGCCKGGVANSAAFKAVGIASS